MWEVMWALCAFASLIILVVGGGIITVLSLVFLTEAINMKYGKETAESWGCGLFILFLVIMTPVSYFMSRKPVTTPPAPVEVEKR